MKSALARVCSPAILVGHSYGGTLITAAGTDARVAGLVYIAALAPDGNETSQSLQAQFPVTDVFSYSKSRTGASGCGRKACVLRGRFAQRGAEARVATHAAPAGDLCNQGRWHCLEVEASTSWPPRTALSSPNHVPMVSNPRLVLDAIRKAADAVQKPEGRGRSGFEGNSDNCVIGPD